MSGSDDFLSRWSRRKHAVRKGEVPQEPQPVKPPAVPPPASAATSPRPEVPPELPPVESLTPDSDFTPFMRKDVEPALRRQALKTLFRDPRFNVMDGLDVYIDDYSKPDPIPTEWLGKLNQMAHLGDYRPPEAESEARAGDATEPNAVPVQAENQVVEEARPVPAAPVSMAASPPPESKDS